LVNFLAFVSFFPQLVAGPIERASHLLPQFERTVKITLPMVEEGLWLMVWGMFKKVALADNLAPLTDLVFQSDSWNAPSVLLGTVAFGFQIYCDFSGYSDIARGSARVLGFDILFNFNLPYAATDPREFWRRWHISLSTWLRDYLYIPLGGNRLGSARTYVNLLATMVLGGLWHGAAWNFVLWGAWHGTGLAVHRAVAERRSEETTRGGARFRALAWCATMLFVFYGWLLFRARSFGQIVSMTRALGDFTAPAWLASSVVTLVAFTMPVILMELWQFRHGGPLAPLRWPRWARGLLEGALLLGIILYWDKDNVPFIYFQF
jgi:D-alanyl-lipoteichoic acid acyltransferase DltB (MBOAT superfamily)